MEYSIKAIPTRYRDVEFRSRLEATWAAYFDLCGVEWEYEPFDLPGWAPDFLLRVGPYEVLAEVKPVSRAGADRELFAKASAYRDRYWVLLLGRAPEWCTVGSLGDQPSCIPQGLNVWLDVHEPLHPVGFKKLWAEATNITRWKGPRS